MAEHFFDTSATVKHYRVEIGTPVVDAYLARPASHHHISALGVIELHSVLARLVRTGSLSPADFHLVRGRYLADIASGLWQVVPVTAHDFHTAQYLLVHHGIASALRTLDALQLAVALGLNATAPLDVFLCADNALCNIAAAEGLNAVNPEASHLAAGS